MPRPKFTLTERAAVLARPDNPHGAGCCWHCGRDLSNVKWHVDHHPVRYADIEDQVCWGVRDPRAMDNLVGSCIHCNTSHRHESTAWCGHSQCRCTRGALMWLAIWGLGATALSGWATAAWLAWG